MIISRLLVAAVAALGVSTAAYAADLVIDEPVIYDPAPVSDWDGLYIGAFGGWAAGYADHTNGDVGPCVGLGNPDGCDVSLSGWLVGVTAGANFVITDGLVGGIAADAAWANITGTEDFGGFIGNSTNTVDFEGSVRGVLGFDGGMFMPYVTAGLAVAHATHDSEVPAAIDIASATHVGATAGLGVAVAVAENVTLDLQYRHSWYNEQEYDHGNAPNNPVFALQTDRVTAGINFNF